MPTTHDARDILIYTLQYMSRFSRSLCFVVNYLPGNDTVHTTTSAENMFGRKELREVQN